MNKSSIFYVSSVTIKTYYLMPNKYQNLLSGLRKNRLKNALPVVKLGTKGIAKTANRFIFPPYFFINNNATLYLIKQSQQSKHYALFADKHFYIETSIF